MDVPTLQAPEELEALVGASPDLYVRYSEGWEEDRAGGSMDTASGIGLPGLSVNPLCPEAWWSRPLDDWLVRQWCQYKHLGEKNPKRFAWVARGISIGRGPDCEPLLVQVEPVARLSEALLAEAGKCYRECFDAKKGPED
ncbi:hypothetical protein FQ154_13185 [Paeniglutamicibacter gangotriensis]|uniref:Uncharacterized protein n=1 Tax=Paeniglutamicibacter gangotriensis TaxID=254787 RepID=A0A5B0ED45_9MICC|nr:DUF6098 family protein [Paeniglutamicibacter gangotriensis]KAA0975751.1 hypothetical protein FQ154_13185 [Paeniglutamicibacter gangotriensis]